MWARVRVRNAPTDSSSCSQIRETSDLLIPESAPQRDHQVVDAAGRDAVNVGLHHHRIQRLVDAAARLQDAGEERSLAELGDPQLDVAAFVASSLGRVPLR